MAADSTQKGSLSGSSRSGIVCVLGDGRNVAESEATYLPPCDPTKILCIHLNYDSRRVEFRAPEIPTPTYFQKPTTALNSHRGVLLRPAGHKYLNYEGEVGVIIGKPMRNVGRDEAWDYIAGFAPANDVGCQDYRETDAGSMLRVKGQDGFCPIGPGIVSGVDVRKSTLRTYINGKIVQEGAISEMIFPIDYILADLSRFITLLPAATSYYPALRRTRGRCTSAIWSKSRYPGWDACRIALVRRPRRRTKLVISRPIPTQYAGWRLARTGCGPISKPESVVVRV